MKKTFIKSQMIVNRICNFVNSCKSFAWVNFELSHFLPLICLVRTLKIYKRTLHQHPGALIHFVLTHTDLLDPDQVKELAEHFHQRVLQLLQNEVEVLQRMKLSASVRETQIVLELNRIVSLVSEYENKQMNTKIFTVSSKTYDGITELKAFLLKTIQEKRVVLPKKWINCFKLMMQLELDFLSYNDFKKVFKSTYKPIEKLVQKFKKMGAANVNVAIKSTNTCLQYFSDTGLVIWYSENPSLQNYIFHSLEFLINIFKSVFHHDLITSLHYSTNYKLQAAFNEVEFRQVVSQYQNEGILSHLLLTHLWEKYNLKSDDTEALVQLMKSFDLCHELHDNASLPDKISQQYFFPWFVKENKAALAPHHWKPDIEANAISLHLECLFHNAIPVNICEMAIVRLQRFAVEHNYIGQRHAWSDGLLVQVGMFDIFNLISFL